MEVALNWHAGTSKEDPFRRLAIGSLKKTLRQWDKVGQTLNPLFSITVLSQLVPRWDKLGQKQEDLAKQNWARQLFDKSLDFLKSRMLCVPHHLEQSHFDARWNNP